MDRNFTQVGHPRRFGTCFPMNLWPRTDVGQRHTPKPLENMKHEQNLRFWFFDEPNKSFPLHSVSRIRRPCLALAKAGRRLGPPWVWSFAVPTLAAHRALPTRGPFQLQSSVPPLCLKAFLRHCSVQWLFQLPHWPFHLQGGLSTCKALSRRGLAYGSKPARLCPGEKPSHPSPQRPAAFPAFRLARLCPCTLLQCLSHALSLRHCSVQWLF